MIFAQYCLVFLFVVSFLIHVYRDFNGTEKKRPLGYKGFLSSMITLLVQVLLLWHAGALKIFGGP